MLEQSPIPKQQPHWRLSDSRSLTLDRPRLMAILNVTPDSFSDGGRYPTLGDAVRAAEAALADGADLIDVGPESTRPGSRPVDAAEQIRRAAPVIGAIRRSLGDAFPITIDTTLEPVARASLDAGADAINDVSAGRDHDALFELAAERRCGIILMHRLRHAAGDSLSTAYAQPPRYAGSAGVVGAVRAFLHERARIAVASGVGREGIAIDPGLGFGKSVEDNLALIARTRELTTLGFPVVSGISRKSFTARAAGLPDDTPPEARAIATVGLSVAHLLAGAAIFRVHDVRIHAQALPAAHASMLQAARAPRHP